jgi:hypothetical protein
MDAASLDSLLAMGCNVTVTGWGRIWLVQLTLMHGDEFCGHTGRGSGERILPALRGAVDALLHAADGSACGVDVEGLKRITGA